MPDTLAEEIVVTWRELRGEHLLPRFLARRDTGRVRRNFRILRALYSIGGPDRFDLGEMLLMSGGVHRGDTRPTVPRR
jgi:hypothetical protein